MREVIDISDIKNCWLVYLKPGGVEENKVKDLQKMCIKDETYRIGWGIGKLCRNYKELDETSIKDYVDEWKKNGNSNSSGLKKALEELKKMQKGDLLIMRLLDNKYYIGQVDKTSYYMPGEILSWGCHVSKWWEFSEMDLPSDILGRFSQRMHSTIQHIADIKLVLLIIKIFKEKINSDDITIPKVQLDSNNYVTSLNYKNLEDLVYEYMLNDNVNINYKLIPSECTVSKKQYEFNLINKENMKDIITCQVKNNKEIRKEDFEIYVRDTQNNMFEKIYLFSGKGQYGEFDEGDARTYLEEKNLDKKLIIILKQELYEFFMNNKETEFLYKKINKYYEKCLDDDNFNNKEKMKNLAEDKGWYKRKGEDKYSYKEVNENIYYYKGKKLIPIYYNNNFKCFVKFEKNNDKEIISKVVDDWTEILTL